MQLDSHRCPSKPKTVLHSPVTEAITSFETQASTTTNTATTNTTATMRCGGSKTFIADDGTEMQTWHSVRRQNVRNMRRMVKRVVLYMALLEAIRVGPDVLVYAGTHGYPQRGQEDFGFTYYAAYILSWIYLCVFSVVWRTFFSWWVSPSSPSDDEEPGTADKYAAFLLQVNMILLPLSVFLSLAEYTYHAVMTFIYVDARPVDSRQLPKNTQKNWLARLMLVVGVFVSILGGRAVLGVLAENDLVHVKSTEYLLILLPIKINLGILFGSLMQWRMEKRQERKKLAVRFIEVSTASEKESLLAV